MLPPRKYQFDELLLKVYTRMWKSDCVQVIIDLILRYLLLCMTKPLVMKHEHVLNQTCSGHSQDKLDASQVRCCFPMFGDIHLQRGDMNCSLLW